MIIKFDILKWLWTEKDFFFWWNRVSKKLTRDFSISITGSAEQGKIENLYF